MWTPAPQRWNTSGREEPWTQRATSSSVREARAPSCLLYTSTSLLISPYQNHEAIAATARAMGEKYGVEFLYRDFRPLFQAGQEFAREHGFYMQKYCGCIFSEEERYKKRKKKPAQPAEKSDC